MTCSCRISFSLSGFLIAGIVKLMPKFDPIFTHYNLTCSWNPPVFQGKLLHSTVFYDCFYLCVVGTSLTTQSIRQYKQLATIFGGSLIILAWKAC